MVEVGFGNPKLAFPSADEACPAPKGLADLKGCGRGAMVVVGKENTVLFTDAGLLFVGWPPNNEWDCTRGN